MSFDLLVFDKAEAPMVFEDFLAWTSVRTEWEGDRDYNSVEGTSPRLAAWFMEMRQTFPPLNGPYCLPEEEMFRNAEREKRLADYSVGDAVIYGAFGWSVAEEAGERAAELARKHGVGLFNPQTYEVVCDEMVIPRMRTERREDHNAAWEVVERCVLSLDDPERGGTNRDGAGMTLWFAQNHSDEEWLQCSPLYPKPAGIFQRLFGAKGAGAARGISSYTVEVGNGEKIFAKQVGSKEEAREIFRDYYFSGKLPDVSGWEDTGIL